MGGDPDGLNLAVSLTGPGTIFDPHTIFVCSALLGNVDGISGRPTDIPKGTDFRPACGFHSVRGRVFYGNPPTLREHEYIVYCYGQARVRYMLRFDKS